MENIFFLHDGGIVQLLIVVMSRFYMSKLWNAYNIIIALIFHTINLIITAIKLEP